MFVRATTVYSREGMIDKLVDIYTKSIIPAAQKQKGYQGAHLLIDRENLKGISLTYWDSEADENATGESQYYSDQLLKIPYCCLRTRTKRVTKSSLKMETCSSPELINISLS